MEQKKKKLSREQLEERQIRISYIVCLTLLGIMIITSFAFWVTQDALELRLEYIRDVTIDAMAIILCGILVYSLLQNKPWDKMNRSLFRLIFVLAMLFYLDALSSYWEGHADAVLFLRIVNVLFYANESMLIYCFWSFIREELQLSGDYMKSRNLIFRILLGIDLLLDAGNYFFGYYFTISPDGEYVNGSFSNFSDALSFVYYLLMVSVTVRDKQHTKKEKLILMTFVVFPIIFRIVSVFSYEYTYTLPPYLFSVMLIYINIFSKRSKKVLEQQVQLEKQSMTLMVSQMQPHFLYNVLTTISNLCVSDPEEAEETTVLFAQYLRTNLDSLRKMEPVSFEEELGHIKTYVELEKKRFGSKLNVEYDINEQKFLVPSLGLQPIVENSIKHGIRGKNEPGHLKITSRKEENGEGFVVIVEDDGIGFDPNAPVKEDGRSHVGMVNVKNRLATMCSATMEVESSPGNGCRTTIHFPE